MPRCEFCGMDEPSTDGGSWRTHFHMHAREERARAETAKADGMAWERKVWSGMVLACDPTGRVKRLMVEAGEDPDDYSADDNASFVRWLAYEQDRLNARAEKAEAGTTKLVAGIRALVRYHIGHETAKETKQCPWCSIRALVCCGTKRGLPCHPLSDECCKVNCVGIHCDGCPDCAALKEGGP